MIRQISLLQRLPGLNPTCKDDCIKILNKNQGKLTPIQYRNIEKAILAILSSRRMSKNTKSELPKELLLRLSVAPFNAITVFEFYAKTKIIYNIFQLAHQ